MDVAEVKALIFDVFGTVVDWRSSIIQHGKQFGKVHGVAADWDAFADAWRAKYRPFMDKVRHGALPWTNLDGLHRMALEEVFTAFKITGLSEASKAEFNLAWHNLRPWPDAVPGLYRLKHRFIIAPMSNGNVALMTNMAKNGGLPCWRRVNLGCRPASSPGRWSVALAAPRIRPRTHHLPWCPMISWTWPRSSTYDGQPTCRRLACLQGLCAQPLLCRAQHKRLL